MRAVCIVRAMEDDPLFPMRPVSVPLVKNLPVNPQIRIRPSSDFDWYCGNCGTKGRAWLIDCAHCDKTTGSLRVERDGSMVLLTWEDDHD